MSLDLDFGNCLWFLIPKHTEVYNLCKELQSTVSDFEYEPHITVEYNMSKNENIYVNKWKKIIENGISLHIKHPIVFDECEYKNFFSLELPIICSNNNDCDVIKKNTGIKPHISFAYRFYKPFTNEEKEKVYKILKKYQNAHLTIYPLLAKEHCHCNRINKWTGNLIN